MEIRQKKGSVKCLMCAGFIFAGAVVSTGVSAAVPTDPDTFLTFLEKYVPEDATSATAYYAVVR